MKEASKIVAFVCVLAILFLCMEGCCSQPATSERMLTLTLPHAPSANEAIRAVVTVGVLPRNARIVVRLADGEIAGTISPFGIRSGRKAGVYMIAIPNGAAVHGKVTLRLELVQKNAETRAPTMVEVEDVKLTLIPVTPAEKPAPSDRQVK